MKMHASYGVDRLCCSFTCCRNASVCDCAFAGMHVVTFQFTAVTFHCSVVLMAQGKSWEDFIALIC